MPRKPLEWVLLAYRLPREPSTPRISVWRKLKRLGVVQLGDGLVALPLEQATREALDWIAEEIVEAGGEATLWVARSGARAQDEKVRQAMVAAIAAEYEAVAAEASAAGTAAPGSRRRTIDRLRRELQRIRRRDYFPPGEREGAEAALAELAATVVEAPV